MVDLISLDYIPGVCNIGPEEIKQRRKAMYYSIIGTTVLTLLFFLRYLLMIDNLALDSLLAGLVLLSAIGTSINTFQVYSKFCVYFGFKGIYNFNKLKRENRQQIENKEARNLDTKKVRKIILLSLVYGILFTSLVVVVDFLLLKK